MTSLVPYLSFDGNCADAMRYYERVLDGKLEALLTNAQTPVAEHCPPGNEDRIMHAYLKFDGAELMAGDALAGTYQPMKGVSLALTYATAAQARRVFDALGDGGSVTMPFDKSFWAEGFGMVTDRYGTNWIVNGGMIPYNG
jgi:PhnB protein